MEIMKKDNRVYFKEKNTSYGNISISENTIKIELIRVIEEFRGKGFASQLLEKIMQYIQEHYKHAKVILSPMPIGFGGDDKSQFNLEQLIQFYKSHKFKESSEKTREEPYLMVRYV